MAQEFTIEAANKTIAASEELIATASELVKAVEDLADLLKGEDIALVNKDQEEFVNVTKDMSKTISEGAEACISTSEGIKKTLMATGNI